MDPQTVLKAASSLGLIGAEGEPTHTADGRAVRVG